ncbi:2-amino-4-hydroxy-6- hydroxymethyldihydropteridine pyrophosphokinase [Liberibacter crescens BT-1]|uniref:2-amino-4-hydroxy-6-hydroxymethyldihydropteridine pyrophosphokinase n=2 Tax=Liberibacter crescens TaxID=1273132 RepID=L0EWP3_LIBCB|nr:2-amino-4-hydroxy-6- hydroxymethyldihydropteridine pyrophosphokinase [Liberibacter crescens BT-1]
MAFALRVIHHCRDCEVLSVSKLYLTEPWGMHDQPRFLNAAALIKTTLFPENLLDLMLSIEDTMKRQRSQRWGPRTLDLDILSYDNHTIATHRLTIPHPQITQRGFVLMPLEDIAPSMLIEEKSVSDWLKQNDVSGIKVLVNHANWWHQESDP